MNTLDSIFSRKSIRTYNGKSITENELNVILKAAYAAPVGRALYDSLNITVISNSDYIRRWEDYCEELTSRRPFYGAPTVILVSSTIPSTDLKNANVNFSNAAIIVQNMALAATELGIGSCHIWGAVRALNDNQELLRELNLPNGVIPCCAIILGYTDEKYELREIQNNRIQTNFIN
ncbi:MAG: nitroreductase family protein [Clostridia bacterium]|nr:nitroreductase family protein [Clostridia bacterium]